MPGYFVNQSEQGIGPMPIDPAVWINGDGRACVDPVLFSLLDAAGQSRVAEHMALLQNEHVARTAEARANEPVFIPPRTIAPASAMERAARDLVQAGVALMAAGNSLKAALPDLDIAAHDDHATGGYDDARQPKP